MQQTRVTNRKRVRKTGADAFKKDENIVFTTIESIRWVGSGSRAEDPPGLRDFRFWTTRVCQRRWPDMAKNRLTKSFVRRVHRFVYNELFMRITRSPVPNTKLVSVTSYSCVVYLRAQVNVCSSIQLDETMSLLVTRINFLSYFFLILMTIRKGVRSVW